MTTVPEFRDAADRPLAVLTAYDAVSAAIVDNSGVDAILVGDSMGTTVLGYDTTLPVTIDQVADRTAAVARGAEDALVIADLPFLGVGVDRATSVEHAGRMLKEADADAVKLESGPHTVDLTRHLVDLGIPVMAHVGLTPQRVRQLGGYRQQGADDETATEIRECARDHADAGAFAVVLEHVPDALARAVTAALDVPTIGIGAGPHTDGQVLVFHDAMGLTDERPPFAQAFGDVRGEIADATSEYVDAVRDGSFPASRN
jgi:3-methyl-2-oxobutanoate hydroxymethyltransferase